MKILITGGAGFLGHHMVEHFLKGSPTTEVVVVDKLTYASAGYDRLRDIQCYDDKRVRVLNCDLAYPIPDGVRHEIGAPDFIVHAAAETHVDNSISDPLPFLKSNVIGTHNVLLYANWLREMDRPVNRVFLISTDEVYGPAPWGHEGFDVGSPMRPGNPYAASKAAAEALGYAYSNTFKIPVTIVNGMNFFGERQHPEKYIPKVIKKVLAGELLQIHADATKTRSGTRFYLHCRNFCSALDFMIRHYTSQPKVHVVGEKEISNLDLALEIARYVGKPLQYELVDFHSSRPGHDLRYAMRDDYLRVAGWKHPIPISESLERTVRWYLDPKNERWLHWTPEI